MNHLSLIIKREYLTKVKNKSFIVMTILSPLIFVALFGVVAYLSQLNNNKERTIAILDASGMLENAFENSTYTKYNILSAVSLDEALEIVKLSKDYGLLYIPENAEIKDISKGIKFYSEESPSLTIMSSLEGKLEKSLTDIQLLNEGVDIEKIKSSKISVEIDQESFSGQNPPK